MKQSYYHYHTKTKQNSLEIWNIKTLQKNIDKFRLIWNTIYKHTGPSKSHEYDIQ